MTEHQATEPPIKYRVDQQAQDRDDAIESRDAEIEALKAEVARLAVRVAEAERDEARATIARVEALCDSVPNSQTPLWPCQIRDAIDPQAFPAAAEMDDTHYTTDLPGWHLAANCYEGCPEFKTGEQARLDQYADAVAAAAVCASGTCAEDVARAVMAVADAELAEAQAALARVEMLATRWIAMGVMCSMKATTIAGCGQDLRAELAGAQPTEARP